MPTSANERYDRLFAKRARPVKPLDSVPDDERDQDSFEPQVAVTRPNMPLRKNLVTVTNDSSVIAKIDSKDDGSKAAASIPHDEHRRKKQNKYHPDLDSRVFETTKPLSTNLPPNLEFIPGGKLSTAKTKMDTNGGIYEQDVLVERSTFGQFCPFRAVSNFPYKYMNDHDDKVSRRFFAANKFYDRTWSLYYIHPPGSLNKGPVLLLPISEVRVLIEEISAAFKMTVTVPDAPFTLNFERNGTPIPQLLGVSKSRDDVTELTGSIPDPPPGHGECPESASQQIRDAYQTFHDKALAACRAGKSKGGKSKKGRNRFQDLEEFRNQLSRLQRYFGLRPGIAEMEADSQIVSDTPQPKAVLQQTLGGTLVQFLNIDQPVNHRFEYNPVIISIDVESYERDHSLITEVGINTLDTLDLINLPPHKAGSNWIKHIRSRHFRLRGREYLINKDFCVGNPNAFQFGRSEFINLDAIAATIDSCFQYPFSVQHKQAGPQAPSYYTASPTTATTHTQLGPETRNIILVGHSTATDITYLQSLNVTCLTPSPNSTTGTSRILATLDTATLFQTLTSSTQTASLSSICATLGIEAWFAHNAGNDARYTLEALVKIAVQARLNEDDTQRRKDPESTGIVIDDVEKQSMRNGEERLARARERAAKEAEEAEERRVREEKDKKTLAKSVSEWQMDKTTTQEEMWW